MNKKMSDNLIIPGCRFSHSVYLNQKNVYWLKDGVQKITATFHVIRNETQRSDYSQGMREYKMNDIEIAEGNYTHQGYYECVIHIPGKYKKKSPQRVDVQFTGIFKL